MRRQASSQKQKPKNKRKAGEGRKKIMWTLSFEAGTAEGERYFVGQLYKDQVVS